LPRLLSVVLSVVLLAAQFVCCQPSFILPDGSECTTCLTLQELESSKSAGLTDADHGDCHDCCTLEACQGENKLKNAAKSNERVVDSLLAVLPEPLSVQCLVPVFSQSMPAFEEAFSSSPELNSSRNRAPPTLSFS
jgi:hypothetical protein